MKPFLTFFALLAFAVSPLWAARQISVGEVDYNPVGGSDYEFVELVNLGLTPFDLSGARFTNGVVYPFKAGTVVPPGGRIVVCNSKTKFAERHGDIGSRLAGSFDGKLSDDGETLTLVDAAGKLLLEFTYGTKGAWPSRANGLGSSLECIDPSGDLDDPANWRSSTEYGGSPGVAGIGPWRPIVINEVLSHTDPPLEDAIELFNTTSTNVDVGGWYLSNSRAEPKKFRIPTGTVIPPRTYKVFYEQRGTGSPAGFNSFGTGRTPEFTFNSAQGDEAVLVKADASGVIRYWVDSVSFDSAENGVSFGRYPDLTGPLVAMSRLTFGSAVDATFHPQFLSEFRLGTGAPNALPKVGPLVFSRIMYHPLTNADEFVEVQNISATNVPLSDPLYPTNTWRIRKAIDFDFPSGSQLAAGAKAIVVPIAPASFRARYTVPADVQVFGPYTNVLDNAGDSLQLFKPDPPQTPPHPDAGYVPYILVEKIDYLPSAPWPVAADGTGVALKRQDPATYGNTAANWTPDAPATAPGVTATIGPGGKLQVAFVAVANVTYVIEGRTEAASGAWANLSTVAASDAGGGVVQAVDLTGQSRFVRVRVQ